MTASSNFNISSSYNIRQALASISQSDLLVFDRNILPEDESFTPTLINWVKNRDTISTVVDIQRKKIFTQCPALMEISILIESHSKELKEELPHIALLCDYKIIYTGSKLGLVMSMNELFKATLSTSSKESKATLSTSSEESKATLSTSSEEFKAEKPRKTPCQSMCPIL